MKPRIAIIGAGLSGLTAAHSLKDIADVTVFEKSRGYGGRLATRYTDAFKFDHGAQYFTAKTRLFKDALVPYIKSGVLKPWTPRMTADLNGSSEKYVGVPHMNAIGKTLAKDLDIVGQTRIISIERLAGLWYLTDEAEQTWGQYEYVICAMPADQVKAMVPESFANNDVLNTVQMQPCFSLMLGFNGPWAGEWDLLRAKDEPFSVAIIDSSKPGRDKTKTAIVVNSDNGWALENVDADRGQIQEEMLESFERVGGVDARLAKSITLHRWLYANVLSAANQDFLHDDSQGLYACGDWCRHGRVEAAYTSGLKLADHIKAQ